MKVFILAHPDDEIFFVPFILNSRDNLFFYLTNGVSVSTKTKFREKRKREATQVFETILQTNTKAVFWLGEDWGIHEGCLYQANLKDLAQEIQKIIEQKIVEDYRIYTTAFEGAHQDHDATSILARVVSSSLNVDLVEISTYPQKFSGMYSFTVMSPQLRASRISFSAWNSVKLAIRIMSSYSTQLTTWVGLCLPIIYRYSRGFYFTSKRTQIGYIEKCFYEQRNRAKQSQVIRVLKEFVNKVE